MERMALKLYGGIIGGCSFTGFTMGVRESYLNHRSCHQFETQVNNALRTPFRGAGYGCMVGVISPVVAANGALDALSYFVIKPFY